MNNKVSFSTLWHSAGIAGIVLASVSVAYMLATHWLGMEVTGWKVIASTALWAVKFFLCVWLMYMFMARFHLEHKEASRADVRHLGMLIAALSALVFATVQMVFFDLHPEIFNDAIGVVTKHYGKLMDANTRNAIKEMSKDLPRYIFASQLIYCYIFGWVLSAILAVRIVKDNPFEE